MTRTKQTSELNKWRASASTQNDRRIFHPLNRQCIKSRSKGTQLPFCAQTPYANIYQEFEKCERPLRCTRSQVMALLLIEDTRVQAVSILVQSIIHHFSKTRIPAQEGVRCSVARRMTDLQGPRRNTHNVYYLWTLDWGRLSMRQMVKNL